MGTVYSSIRMAVFMRVTSKIRSAAGKENLPMEMEMCMKENGKQTNAKGKNDTYFFKCRKK